VRPPRWTAVALVAAFAVACAETPTTREPADPAPTSEQEQAPPDDVEDVGRDLLAFTGRTLDGDTFDGGSLRGDVLVWFWAPW
jgi:hypothetical protein